MALAKLIINKFLNIFYNLNQSIIMKKLITPITMPTWWQDAFLAIPRIVYGYFLSVNFGSSKFGMPWSPDEKNLGLFEVAFWFPNDVAEFGGIFALAPAFFAWMAGFSEAVGGVAWMLGFKTRLFSFLILCTMFVAVFFQQINNGLWNMMGGMGYLWISMFYMVLGSGRFGVDYLWSKKLKN
jgi:putative oxidoreductase